MTDSFGVRSRQKRNIYKHQRLNSFGGKKVEDFGKTKVEMVPTKYINKRFIKINGKYYSPVTNKIVKDKQILSFKEIDLKEYEKTIDELAEKISKKTNVKKLLKQGLYELNIKDLEIIKKEMKKETPLVRNNDGCFFLTIGKARLQLRD